ncbi:hypothetical protein, partial [Jatrophihabitans sp.]|uniref:hypothetical protein n=1 Tax=Jatrophihabitans sp. TaxID=1932789 RepID=UPI002EEA6609
SGTIVSTPPPDCAAGTVTKPDWPSEAAGVVPTYRTVPASVAANCPGKVVTFLPGYYDDAQALSSLMDGNGTCKNSVWWFTPGTYYFDFHNTSNPLLSGSDVWTVKDGWLVGGTPVDVNGVPVVKPASPATIPGACQNPIKDDTPGKGVQFIFGGDSQLRVTNSAGVELCANYHAHDKMIAVYGVRSGDDPMTPPTATTKPATVTSADAVYAGTVTAAKLANVDTVGATWTKATALPSQTGNFALSGYVPTTIPAGSVLKSATLKVVYQNTAGAAGDVRTVTFTPAGGTAITTTLPATSGSGVQTASLNVFGSSTGSLAAAVHSGTLTGASVSYSAKLAHIGTETIDAIQLDLGYLPPTFRGENTTIPGGNCLTSTYTGGSAGQCAVLSTPTAYAGAFYIQGTTYVTEAVIDLALNNITSQVLRFGVVARALWVKETGSISYSGPVIEVPDNSTGYGPGGTVVYLDVYLCQAASTCSAATGKLGLRARVLIYDPTSVPNPPARQITIQSWAVQR